ncbi:Signal transduction histidine kinase [Hahella chejuensis KCTC 2396]|uniref:histidine kinase n=1 Tax=Hahella chejuensis (strain KCTC 2396) TaxID=349521 RepID=Q2SB54_HAHCH|nr:ATP-binding protein [Hahella chejuensis]ABC32120.1 Signal transduction histidine kinase [Hahella chejuensis KCTC 2396]
MRKTSNRILSALLLITVVALAATLFQHWQLHFVSDMSRKIIDQDRLLFKHLDQVGLGFTRLYATLERLPMESDPEARGATQARFLERYKSLSELINLSPSRAIMENTSAIDDELNRHLREIALLGEQMFHYMESASPGAAMNILHEKISPLRDNAINLLNRQQELVDHYVHRSSQGIEERLRFIEGVTVISVVVLLITCLGSGFRLTHTIIRPFRRVTRHLRAMQDQPQFINLPEKDRDDDLGLFIRTLHNLLQRLQQANQLLAGAKNVAESEAENRREAERQTRVQKDMLASIIDHIPVAVFAKDVKNDYRFLIWNSLAEKLFEANREDIIGKTDYDIFPNKEEVDFFRSIDEQVMRSGEVVNVEVEPITTSRGTWLAHTTKVPIFDEKGEPETLLGILEDITEKQRADEQLREYAQQLERQTRELTAAKEKAERANRVKSQFLANMSHELRTPVHAILGFTSLCLKRVKNVDELAYEHLSEVKTSAEGLLDLLNNLLDLAKLESGRMVYAFTPVDILAVQEKLLKELRPLWEKKELQIVTEDLLDSPYVVCDGAKITQVLRNLLSNAIKFSPQQGRIRLRIAHRMPDMHELLGLHGLTLERLNKKTAQLLQQPAKLIQLFTSPAPCLNEAGSAMELSYTSAPEENCLTDTLRRLNRELPWDESHSAIYLIQEGDVIAPTHLEGVRAHFDGEPTSVYACNWRRAGGLSERKAEKLAKLAQEVGVLQGPCWKLADVGELQRKIVGLAPLPHESQNNILLLELSLMDTDEPVFAFSVSDQGAGIPEAELESIFDKFVQSSSTDTGAGGTGLGLAICREIIKAHRGLIYARNHEQGGADFTALIPEAEPSPT